MASDFFPFQRCFLSSSQSLKKSISQKQRVLPQKDCKKYCEIFEEIGKGGEEAKG